MEQETDQPNQLPNQSSTIGKLAAALAKAQGQITSAAKTKMNPHFKSDYADLASIWGAVREPLSKNELAVVQTTLPSSGGVTLKTTLVHSSGEWISGELYLPAPKDNPQGYGSAMTYARRYALAAIVGIAQDDDDANKASEASEPKPKPAAGRSKKVIKPSQTKEAAPKDESTNKIAEAREAKGLSQSELADLVGVKQFQIAKFERGLAKPDAEVALLIAAKLGLSITEVRA